MEISGDNSNGLRVASFSCYLKTPEENFVLKLAGLQDTSSPPFMSPPPETSVPRGGVRRTSMENQRDHSVFAADKYYRGRMDYDGGVQKQGHVDLHHVKPSLFTARTPSISSEASSWNSQSGLLQGLQRNPSQMKQRSAVCRRFFPSFGCNGPCATKKAVNVDEIGQCGAVHDGSKRSQLPGLKNGEQFASQALNPRMEKMTVQTPLEVKIEEDPRKSIEVFGSNMLKKGDIAKNLERKLSILTWDAIPKAQDASTTYVSSGAYDDMASEASSDLFEIENLSGNGLSLLTRQPSERLSSCMMSPTTQYAPSEASIQWSVVTASAADFSSAASEYDENYITAAANMMTRTADRGRAGTAKEAQKGGSRGTGRLLGCKSYKSVRVAESTCKTADIPKH